MDKKDYLLHLKEALKYEQAGEYKKQIRALEFYQRDGGDDKEPLLKLLELYNEEGRRKNYKRLLKKLLEKFSDDEVLKQKLRDFLSIEDDTEYFKKFIEPDKYITEETLIPDEQVILRFTELFSGREGVYARMWSNYDNSISYSVVNEPFTFNIAKNHLLGNYTIGIYPVRIDNTVVFSAFDIDIKKSFLKEALYDGEQFNKLKQDALSVANSIKESLNVYGLNSYIEESGYKGYHIWLFFEEPIAANYVKRFMENVVEGVEKKDSIGVEIFPKQGKVKENRYGSLIKLPGSYHLKTGKRTKFIDAEDDLNGFYQYLLKIRKNSKEKILDIITQLGIEEKKEEESKIDLREFGYLRAHCPVLDYLSEKAERGEPLSREERNAMIYTIGHIEDGPEIVNFLLKNYIEKGDLEPLKKRLKGYPMSCAKIRRNLKYITSEVACNCVFEDEGSYPNPILHLRELTDEKKRGVKVKPFLSDFQKSIDKYLALRKKTEEIKRELESIEEYFNKKFIEAGVDVLETDMGTFRRVVNPNGKVSFFYELK